jgi:membrane-bound metal-dependent hydrolase YbcI (DUF457 family)
MTTATHTAVGYLIAKLWIHSGILPASLEPQIIGVAILAANAPDFDALAVWRGFKHRVRSPFHKPILWAALIIPLLLYTHLADLTFQYSYLMMIQLAVFSHFILDSIDFSPGITWFWPFDRRSYTIWKRKVPTAKSYADAIAQIRKNPMMLVDLAFSLAVYFLSRGGR